MDKVKQIVGKTPWMETTDDIFGSVIKPPSDKDENKLIFENFDCANVK